ncbi:MAG: hypothetical protein A2Y73_07955 [Chloroflexi bacterium RBG_13_56_8]|nr:MAG: hypothetical protein A2Y73_07955 [Chloroflexi bacterium RBG_13_56_8]
MQAKPGAENWSHTLWREWYLAHVFHAHQAGDSSAVRQAAWRALRYDWRLFRNRGLVSLLASAVIDPKLADVLRRAARLFLRDER